LREKDQKTLQEKRDNWGEGGERKRRGHVTTRKMIAVPVRPLGLMTR
jgi:hypothetical protein